MRIAMVHASFTVRGGAERYIDDLTASLVARGHQVRVFTAADRPRWSARLPGNVAVHLGDLLDPTGLRPADLREFAPDVVHVHNWQGLGVPVVARLAAAYPTVHTVHDHAVVDPNNTMRNVGRSRLLDALLRARSAWILRRFTRLRLLCATDRVRDTVLRGASGARRPTSRVVPLAVATDWNRRAWPVGDRRTFLFLGALSAHKGLDQLLDAWDGPGTLLVAGDGPLRARVERSGPSVRALGYLDEAAKRAAVGRAGWLVFPSTGAETYGLACAEALMAGRPLIAGAHAPPPMAAGTSTLLYTGVDGLRVALRRAAAMPPDEYAAMAASAAADGRKLDWDDHVSAVLDAYEER
ncbi:MULTISPECIES: glycosyltransferase [unclassified Solwaraspora]|uniref:glycosyltransferase n=1 Tax=unclassified Solwaraspora TaxID=2627926 RepID=UPI00259B7700|nr:glycosyltransferase [Solwaraspora sp. WMMA2056]WJK39858.1 glycosyltransferase [Solwaraspora sp. WMMA2056]